MKELRNLAIGSLIGAIITITITSIFAYPGNVKNNFEKQEAKIIEVKEYNAKEINKVRADAYRYTDEAIDKHEAIESKRDDMLIKYLDQRFNDMEKLIKK